MAAAPHELLLPPVSVPASPARLHAVDDENADFAAAVDAAEAAVARRDWAGAVDALARSERPHGDTSPLSLRALLAEAAARMELGELDAAVALASRARALSERPGFSEVDRAAALFRLGCCRFRGNAVANAVALLTLALGLCDRSIIPSDRLRAEILDWRSRCYQRQRDWHSARADVERGLELAKALGDDDTTARLLFQASIVAEREKQWLLARFYLEAACAAYERVGETAMVPRLLNNLAGVVFLLGETEEAVALARRARDAAAANGDELFVGYATSTLAQLRLRTGDAPGAEADARAALERLAERPDHAAELGNAQLVLGRSLAAQGRYAEADAAFADAEDALAPLGSASHLAEAWMARAETATARADTAAAAAFYRRAAEALQDVHF